MRLTLVIPELAAGGAERVLTTLANAWVEEEHDITILTLDDGANRPFFPLDVRVQHHALAVAGASDRPLVGLMRNLRRMYVLRCAFLSCQPQVIISFMDQTNVLTLCASFGLGLPVVVTEHTDPAYAPLPRVWELLRRLTYPLATRLILLNHSAMSYFAPRLRKRARIIPNPVMLPPDTPPSGQIRAPSRPILLAIGRLVEVKGFDRLLRAWAHIAPHHPDWSLEIWGEGPARAMLEALVGQLQLAGQVRLPGLTREPLRTMQAADLFVVTSQYEGFSLVLAEAMACGLPVVSFDCPSGPRELIRQGVDGLLVPDGDIDALAACLDRLMCDPAARQKLAIRAPEVLERCGLPVVMRRWNGLIQEVIAR